MTLAYTDAKRTRINIERRSKTWSSKDDPQNKIKSAERLRASIERSIRLKALRDSVPQLWGARLVNLMAGRLRDAEETDSKD